jgi:hypothetical protein
VRTLTMTDDEYQQIERQLTARLGHQEDLGFSGSGAKHALGILARATEEPQEPCGEAGCPAMVPEHQCYCPRHEDYYEQVDAMRAAG